MAVAVAVAVSGGVAVPVAVPVAGITKRFFNHIQKRFLNQCLGLRYIKAFCKYNIFWYAELEVCVLVCLSVDAQLLPPSSKGRKTDDLETMHL